MAWDTKQPDAPRTPGEEPVGAPAADGRARLVSVFRWGLLMGGLVVITDLTGMALLPGIAESPEVASAVLVAGYVLNLVFYSIAGRAVCAETGQVGWGAAAGLVAGLVDGLVVGAALAMTVAPAFLTPELEPADRWLETVRENVVLGTAVALMAAWFLQLGRRRKRP